MSFDWLLYRDLARHLVDPTATPPDEEARLRCAISRAYYAAHCHARNHLRDRENRQFALQGGAHEEVIATFRDSADRARQQISANLHRLKNSRVTADYYDDGSSLGTTNGDKRRKAQQCLLLVDSIVQALASLPAPPRA